MKYKALLKALIGSAALAVSGAGNAVPVITANGAKFSVYANTNVGNTITFRYFADFREMTSASPWWNAKAAGLSLDFNEGALIKTQGQVVVDKGSITFVASNALGTWEPFIDKLSAGGCTDSKNDAACLVAKRNAQNPQPALTVLNGQLLFWDFTVTFLDASEVFTKDHNLKFLATDGTTDNKNEWTKIDTLVSQDVTIQCCDIPDEPVPEPGTLMLLGLGLLGLGVSRKRAAI